MDIYRISLATFKKTQSLKKESFVQIGEYLTGKSTEISLEGRIFHSVCALALIVIGLNIPFNYAIGLPGAAALMMVLFIFVSLIYYYSRFKNYLKTGITVFQVFNCFLLLANYYYNSGINGPSYAIFLLSFLVTVTIIPARQYYIWLPINIAIILVILWAEQAHPGLIKNRYASANDRYLDFSYTYLVVVAMIFLVIRFVLHAYNEERLRGVAREEALALSNQTKNKLLSILAHDLKDPLNSIQGFLELLINYKLDEKEKITIEKELLLRTKGTSHMLANVLAWTKGQMEAVAPLLTELNLFGTLDPTLKLLQQIAKEKGIELTYNIDPQFCVTGDRDMLQLVIRNLVMNAIKFTHPGGDVQVSAQSEQKQCLISVKDTGSGIAKANQAGLFSIGVTSTYGTGNEKGVGLGLMLCKEFIELQNGSIGFTSEPGKGSNFFIRLDLCGEAPVDKFVDPIVATQQV